MLFAAEEREHNEYAQQARLQGTEVPFMRAPAAEEELPEIAAQDEAVKQHAERAMARRSARVKDSNG